MGIQSIGGRPILSEQFIPAGASGSYAVSSPLTPGIYRVQTDTTQNISATNFYIQSPEGFIFGAPIRGGQGYLPVPVSASVVYITSGTFPLPLNLERAEYTTLTAPSASIVDYLPASLSFNVSLPPGATGFNVYWPNGTNASVSGSAASIAVPAALLPFPPTVTGLKVAVAARDSNNVIGQTEVTTLNATYPFPQPASAFSANFYTDTNLFYSASVPSGTASVVTYWDGLSSSATSTALSGSITNPGTFANLQNVIVTTRGVDSNNVFGLTTASFDLGVYPWVTYTSSSVFVVPPGTSQVDVYLVGGGGGGQAGTAGSGNASSAGGGGGGSRSFSPAVPVSGSITVTVGAGGSGNANGTSTSFGPLTAAGGNFGPFSSSGGIGGSSGPRTGGSRGPTSDPGFRRSSGGGAGAVGNGGNAVGPLASPNGPYSYAGGGGAGANWVPSSAISVGGGGGGGNAQGALPVGFPTGAGVNGGGNGGVAWDNNSTGPRVGPGANGLANRGGGGGGPAALGATSVASSGGGGRVTLKLL